MIKKTLCFALISSFCAHAYAQVALVDIKQSNIKTQAVDGMLFRAGLKECNDDIMPTQDISKIELNPKQQHEASVWGISELDEKRYVLLMQNKSKIFYKGRNLTPIDILGLNARNEQERNKFAAILAKLEAEKVAKNIAWNNAYHKAYLNEVKDLSVVGDFDPSPYSPYAYKPVVLNDGDLLHFFASNKDSIDSMMISVLKTIYEAKGAILHITLVDGDAQSMQVFANHHHIPHELVDSGKIVLDIGSLGFNSLSLKNKKTPLLLLSNRAESRIVDLGKF